jgi:NAD(P)-dependent dehydrogenase (short-subunit alcohol dehydrogenase family)
MPEDRLRLDGKVALVTGAGSGIGKATAILMAGQGARVALLGRSGEELDETSEEIRKLQGACDCMKLTADISKSEEMKREIGKLGREWGEIGIVFANAGINGVWAPIDDLKPEEWDQTLDVNLSGTFHTIKYAVPYMREHGGSIVITSSVNGTRIFTNTGATAYSCTKAAQVAMGKMLAIELARDRIRVNVICPGAIETNIGENTERRNLEQVRLPVEFPEGHIPLTDGKPGTAEQTADLVLFLASEMSSHISGAVVFIDGAESLMQG